MRAREAIALLFAVVISTVVMGLLDGCGSSALQRHAVGIQVAKAGLRADTEVRDAISEHRVRHLDDEADRLEAVAPLQPWADAHAVVVAAVDTWDDAVTAALAEGGRLAKVWEAAKAVGRLWSRLVQVARRFGHELPLLPEWLREWLLEAGGPGQ